MNELTLHVAGMGCRRCIREVTARLRDVAGVETVTVDASRSRIQLSGSMTFGDIVRALDGTPYRPEFEFNAGQDAAQRASREAGRKVGNESEREPSQNRRGTEPGQDVS